MTWSDLFPLIKPELVLVIAACALFLLGAVRSAGARKSAPILALIALICALPVAAMHTPTNGTDLFSTSGPIQLNKFSLYVKVVADLIGMLLVLLNWPTDEEGTGNASLNVGSHLAEYFGLMMLSLCGIFLVAGANDFIILFLGIELASIPTYIMVSISRPIPAAQEAGVKYFFLGAMAAALMLFGFSYLYGSTGSIQFSALMNKLASTSPSYGAATVLSRWELLGVLFLIAGFSFKIAAFPLHFYVGDVYEGAATPMTALLSFVPKATGIVALIKLLYVVSGGTWHVQANLTHLFWWLAVLTMTVGNCLGLLQHSVKRVLGCSSIAHSGYMLAAVALALDNQSSDGIAGVLFYLAAYGLTNVAAFGVLMMIPSRHGEPATTAETFEDLAGAGRKRPATGLAMAVACFSLTGIPLTVGFFGKIYLIRPALHVGGDSFGYWLVAIMMINAAISAAYYLRIIDTMFLRTEPAALPNLPVRIVPKRSLPLQTAIVLSTAGTLALGTIFSFSSGLNSAAKSAANVTAPAMQTASAR